MFVATTADSRMVSDAHSFWSGCPLWYSIRDIRYGTSVPGATGTASRFAPIRGNAKASTSNTLAATSPARG